MSSNVDIVIRGRDAFSQMFSTFKQKVQNTFGNLQAQIAGAIGGLGIAELVKSSIGDFAEAEAASVKLAAALDMIGAGGAAAMEDFKAFAESVMNMTVLDDDAVVSLGALGASMGKLSGDTLKQATLAAIGFSRSLKMDLDGAMKLVVKAAEGNTTAFAKYGVQLADGLTDSEKFQAILRRGIDDFKLAQAETETTAGRMSRLNVAVGNLKETIGAALAPTLLRITEAMVGWAKAHEDLLPKIAAVMGGIAAFLVVGPMVTTAVTALGAAISLATSPVLLVGVALGALVYKVAEAHGGLQPLIQDFFRLTGATTAANMNLSEMGDTLLTGLLKPITSVSFALTELLEDIVSLNKMILPGQNPVLEQMAKSLADRKQHLAELLFPPAQIKKNIEAGIKWAIDAAVKGSQILMAKLFGTVGNAKAATPGGGAAAPAAGGWNLFDMLRGGLRQFAGENQMWRIGNVGRILENALVAPFQRLWQNMGNPRAGGGVSAPPPGVQAIYGYHANNVPGMMASMPARTLSVQERAAKAADETRRLMAENNRNVREQVALMRDLNRAMGNDNNGIVF